MVVSIAHFFFFHAPVKHRGKSGILSSHTFHLLPVQLFWLLYCLPLRCAAPAPRGIRNICLATAINRDGASYVLNSVNIMVCMVSIAKNESDI